MRLNVELSEVLTSNRSCIASILFANVNFTHVKITPQGKSTLSVDGQRKVENALK